MKVGDLVLEHIDYQTGIIVGEEPYLDDKIKYYRVLFPSCITGIYSELYLEIVN
jgi:hypothetical protein